MDNVNPKSVAVATTATAFVAAAQGGSEPPRDVAELITRIRSKDEAVRGEAWQSAERFGAPAVQPLGGLLADPEFEIARSAKRALYRIVRHANRPGAEREATAVEVELIEVLKVQSTVARRSTLWMLSEIGSDKAVKPISAFFTDPALREDARCALLRIPGKRSTAALRSAFTTAPPEFKYALADSLRERGEKVEGFPSRKLVPTAQTSVAPLPAK
jgi:HEAT repeat protein